MQKQFQISERFPKLTILIALGLFFLLLEGSIWSLLFVKATDILHERQSKGLVDIGEVNDVHFVYGTHHPYRGFALPENYQGKYVQTDELGFRNTPGNWKSSLPKIAYFGGSTMFSTVTNQENTIPAILQKRFKTFTHLNLGVALLEQWLRGRLCRHSAVR